MSAGNAIPWPADAVQRRALAELVPYARNARTHSEAQVEQIAGSIREWGFTVPVLVDEVGMIIAGHGRVLAAAKLGLGEIPTVVARGWSEARKRAYVIADNKLTDNGGWDESLLQLEIADITDLGFDLSLMGFGEEELARLTQSNPGRTDPDATPDPPQVPVAQRGELWQLGRHRLLCGDATSGEDVARVLGGVKPGLMVTDPPYGVNYDANWRNERARSSAGMGNRAIGAGAVGKVENDSRADWTDAWNLFGGDVAYVWCASLFSPIVAFGLSAARFDLRALIIWDKTRLIIGRSDYHWQHEPCWYAVRKGKAAHWVGGRTQTTVWAIPHRISETGHSTQKPVECMKRPIENNSSPGQAVYDPFLGSGTTIIAAEIIGRSAFGLEIDPAYVDVAIERWQNFTGEKAQRV
jgi:DNA modification methylase